MGARDPARAVNNIEPDGYAVKTAGRPVARQRLGIVGGPPVGSGSRYKRRSYGRGSAFRNQAAGWSRDQMVRCRVETAENHGGSVQGGSALEIAQSAKAG